MYHKYDDDTDTAKLRPQDKEVHEEFSRQRMHLETMIANLQRRLNAGIKSTGKDVIKIMDVSFQLNCIK